MLVAVQGAEIVNRASRNATTIALGKKRLDVFLMEKGLAESRQKGQALILAGNVLVDGQKEGKAGRLVGPEARVEVIGPKLRYASRGGLKLEAALAKLAWDVGGCVAMDIGSATGGFVDCLLQHGAARVIAVDVGVGQLDWRLRQDPRVRLLAHTNARHLRWEQVGEQVDLVTMDASFISATLILPALAPFARQGTRLLVLVKPQFEVGKGQVGKGGIVRDARLHQEAVERVRRRAAELGWADLGHFPSAVLGAEGNQEFFLAGMYAGPEQASASEQD
jgi:23S rRNA (cytidine1920-2'-O)/16S rRNA (cytidine1409-2'-O)-methyltransferase